MLNLILKISFICIFGLGVFIFFINIILFRKIKKDEPEFIKNHPSLQSDYFSINQNFPWIIFFGKYKTLKSPILRFWCVLNQVLFFIDSCCILLFMMILFLK